jgi:branched-chain amino acid transport system ATP-binding protein
MLLDEPTAGLSPLFAGEVFRVLRELCAGDIAMVVVEQNARTALQWCDYAFVLREGQVAFSGTAEACRADEETLKNYLGVGVGKTMAAIRGES